MKIKLWLAGLVVMASVAGIARATGDDKKETAGFGALEATDAKVVQTKALAWLAKANGAKVGEGEAIWNRTDRTVLDNLADTFALGNADAAKLLKQVRDDKSPPPDGVPALLTDTKADPFFRANLGLAVARHLSNRRVHEEALSILTSFTPEQTIDPAAYLFHRAICEHSLLKKDDAFRTLDRLTKDVAEGPERYKRMATLMMLDMQTWKKDLSGVARLMDISERRLEVGRGGPKTQKVQKEVIARIDELIKELENKVQSKPGGGGGGGGGGDPNGGACPEGSSGGSGGGNNVTSPMQTPRIVTAGGSGKVDQAKIQKIAETWGKMTPAEREKAMQEVQDLLGGLAPEYREAWQRYFDELERQAIQGTKKNQ